ncbi:MAG: hypothetical protein ACLVJH_04570 [Faecalibacterium prausnitzii]
MQLRSVDILDASPPRHRTCCTNRPRMLAGAGSPGDPCGGDADAQPICSAFRRA